MPSSSEFWFGNVGKNFWMPDPLGTTGRVVRTVNTGVVYHAPPPATGVPVWKKREDASGEWDEYALGGLPAEGGRPVKLWTLYRFAEELRPRRRKMDPNDPLLDELDWVVVRLLAVMERLHADRRPLGLIHPLNILWYHGEKGRVLVLPDVGFTTEPNSSPPTWLTRPDELEQQIKNGRDKPSTLKKQELAFRKGWYPEPWEAHHRFHPPQDVAAVARVLDWVLSGEIRTAVPPAEDDPATQDAVYDTLAPAVASGMPTAAEFRKALVYGKQTRVSLAYLANPRGRTEGGWGRWLWGLLLVGLLAGGGGVAYLTIPQPGREKSKPVDIFPALSESSTLYPHLKRLQELLDTPPERSLVPLLAWLGLVTETVEAAGQAATESPAEGEEDREKERQCLLLMRQLARKAFDEWLKELLGLETAFAEDGNPKALKGVIDRARTAEQLVERMQSPTPKLPEDEPWDTKIVEDIKRHRAEFERVLAKAGSPQ